jgi:hypothetical protein
MTRIGRAFGLLVATAVLAGCATHWDVDTFAAPEGDVPSRQTYFWKGGDFASAAQIDRDAIAAAETQVRAKVTPELARKGYREVADAATADLVVSYQVSGMRRFVLQDNQRVGAPLPQEVLSPSEMQPPPASEVPREITVRDGSVALYLDDTKLGRLVWRGEVSDEIRADSAEQVARVISNIAQEIAKSVPARSGAK